MFFDVYIHVPYDGRCPVGRSGERICVSQRVGPAAGVIGFGYLFSNDKSLL